ncbi:MAG TPA: hypothetical protein VHV51_07070 [Polyangiaceae bacterium]|nr:hypothetical protein [Polyangiaceae bacterium]
MKRRAALLALPSALWYSASCTPKHAPPPKTNPAIEVPELSASTALSSGAAHAKAAPAPPSVASACAEAATELSESSVTGLVERWRQTQKKHDFAGYSALYSEHFSGLSSDNSSFSRLDRSGWLQAHEAILGTTPALFNATPRIALGAGGALVTFGARSNARVDLPELFVVANSNTLEIVREAAATPPASELARNARVWLAEERFAILSTLPDPTWSEGAPSFVGENSAQSPVAFAHLPKALSAWLGHPVRVLGERGTVCETRLQRFAIRAQISPNLATTERWEGCGEERERGPAAIAQEIWSLSANEGRTLVAEFSTPCKGALFAIDPDLPMPAIAAPRPAPAELGQAALAALRALPTYQTTQARFKTEHADVDGDWDDHDAKRGVWLFELPGHAPLVFASVEAGAGCSSFSASVSGLWEALGGSELRLLAQPRARDEHRLTPRVLADFGDGAPELLLGPDGVYRARSLLLKTSAGYTQRQLTSVPFFGGPC